MPLGAAALVAYEVDGYQQREIADLLGKNPSTICRALRRARPIYEMLVRQEIARLACS